MNWLSKKLGRGWWGGVVGTLLTLGTGVLLLVFHPGEWFVAKSYELLFQFRRPTAQSDVVIVYLDDESHKALDQPHYRPWDRSLHARLIRRLQQEGARAVAFDMIFDEPSANPAADVDMAGAMKAFSKVALAADFISVKTDNLVTGQRLVFPHDDFQKVAGGIGHVVLPQDPDFMVREFPETIEVSGNVIPTIAQALLGLTASDDTLLSKPHRGARYINYIGPPFTIPNISYSKALDPSGTPPGFFKGKVVFVGSRQNVAYTGGGKDEFPNPCPVSSDDKFSPGVEIHAMIYLNELHQQWLVRVPLWLELLVALGLSAWLGFGLCRRHPFAAAGLATLCGLIIVLLAFALFYKWQVWFAWVVFVEQILVGGAWAVVFTSIQLQFEKMLLVAEQKLLEQQKQVLRESLTRHLSPARVEQLLQQPDLLKPVTHKQTISILFSDIEAYSRLSEMLELEELAEQLNGYYEAALGCVTQTDGTVVKLIGDAIFAIWNAPFPQEDHRIRVCQAALLLSARLQKHNTDSSRPPLRTRIGLHCGEASVGNIGSSSRFDYTAIGDSVNVASRLEGLNKHLGTLMLATREIKAAADHLMIFRPVGLFRFKGVQKVNEVYELVGLAEHEADSRAWRQCFEQGLSHFFARQWDLAEASFSQVLKIRPEDGPAQFYLKKIEQCRQDPPPPDWNGEVNLTEK